MPHNTVALIVAAGRGVRAGSVVPKQFVPIAGVPVIARAVDAFAGMPVFVVIAAGQEAMLAEALGGRDVTAVIGGAERQDSVLAGLQAIGSAERMLIHDAARPLLPRAVIDRLLVALETHDGAVPVLPVVDTVARTILTEPFGLSLSKPCPSPGAVREAKDSPSTSSGRTGFLDEAVDRAALVRVQTPQAFRFDAIMASHARWVGPAATDDAQMARAAGFTVATVEGDAMLDKITSAEDFASAEARLATRLVSRSAAGFDVHRLEFGEELWLGGIRVPHDKGLSGHSDADVALHAITDAVLGCIGEGDIGTHFPPSDARWRGASSGRFLDHARGLVAAKGGIIDFIDLTIICEAPKIGPHRDAMRAQIAAILQVPPVRISLKATTTERLGFTGRGEGIAAQAIATVRLPEVI